MSALKNRQFIDLSRSSLKECDIPCLTLFFYFI
uniref:Uncharacterized protein n=1 Tax=Siphoviridae sp. ctFKD2 TaxID=2825403 RepID=A0A8S5NYU2_9CAUD|nr:MAG TPA: hypothetical protein [Siphoviridae sp. ctFKD2]